MNLPSDPVIAVIVAAGSGRRMGSAIRKQYLILEGVPVITRTLTALDTHPRVSAQILVLPEADIPGCRDSLIHPFGIHKPVHLTAGGNTRQESVMKGISCAQTLVPDPQKSLVLIHDGVRPFVSHELISHLIACAAESGACIPVLPVTDTLKQVDDRGIISRTLNRERVFRAQTPQVFRLDLIHSAHIYARNTGFSGTDDASVMEHARLPVATLPGSDMNIKLTTARDMVLAGQILATSSRQGSGGKSQFGIDFEIQSGIIGPTGPDV